MRRKGFKKDGSLIQIDTKIWMRPKTACNVLRDRGISVSHSLMNYWKNEGKIESMVLKELDDLTLVNIETIPKELKVSVRI